MARFAAIGALGVFLAACADLSGLTGGASDGGAHTDAANPTDGSSSEEAGADGGSAEGSCAVPGNLLAADDPSFEQPACAGWSGDHATLSSSSVDYCGSFSCEACPATSSAGPVLDPSLAVLPGEVYVFSGWVRSIPGGPPVSVHAACHVDDANGNEVEDIDGNSVVTSSSWQEISDLCAIVDGGATLTVLAFHADNADAGCFLSDQAVLLRVPDAGP